jgi:hypothetical protein
MIEIGIIAFAAWLITLGAGVRLGRKMKWWWIGVAVSAAVWAVTLHWAAHFSR